ncbi:uncharacterized protein IL334_005454 [Kwoniella shivajii]|uniref:AAA+ ATPase domain-containing protein n=1 Tax=Kwoniella shivajii TaxID=564305 RepID=A0ABZ1D3I1_9TREE|nr:hypothetical protein IL334_005454 [Kwoniella shivajii]
MEPPITRLRAVADEAGPSVSGGTRDIRRAYLSPDLLRTHKLVAGDWVLLKSDSGIIAVQSWPRVGLDDDAIVLSSIQLINLSSTQVDLLRFKPDVHCHGKAQRVQLKESTEGSARSKSKSPIAEETSREKEWLKASLKEITTSMNFLRVGMRIRIGDLERASRQFEILLIDPATKEPFKKGLIAIEDELDKLKISSKDGDKVMYEASWKTEIVVGDEDEGNRKPQPAGESGKSLVNGGITKQSSNTPDGPMPSYINLFTPSQPPTAAYALIGGLQPQIEQIKSLLDLPLLHPALYTSFGLTPPRGILLHGPPGTEHDISSLSARTHGYVGADLSSLIRESASAAIQRWHVSNPSTDSKPTLTNFDVLTILPTVRPSAMREVFVETPTVKWSDIGGQQEVKQKLRECVEWPLTHRDTFTRLGVEAPRGVLLYGPPGCSKTMTAKALATESGLNFIAVKGPELLNKYVGESERAVREIFRKARAASPSIVFFDEIDALGSARSDDHTHSGVLTSLLNEMDGIEELSGVTVVAATNRPDILDSALMRPGRLDRILYVGAPDLATRKDIFNIRLASMAIEPGVDADELAHITEGCSGAEVASICQDAALAAMNEDLNAPYVKHSHLVHSAKTVRRRITQDMIDFFQEWKDQSGVRSA